LLKGLAVLALVSFAPLSASADQLKIPEAGAETEDDVIIYTIVKDDTLWDISDKYLEDPFKWPRIWKVNPYIKNPHLIFPGDVVRITPDGLELIRSRGVDVGKLPVDALEPVPERVVTLEPEVLPPTPPTGPKLVSDKLARQGFITEEEFKASGAIIEAKEHKLLMEEGDDTFVSFNDRDEVEVGKRYAIFTTSERIKHPVTGRRLGHMIDILGSLVITGDGKVTEARIENSFKEIEKGSKLTPYKEPTTEVEITDSEDGVNGYVVAALEGYKITSGGDIVYIDRGSSDGVQKGNVMRIFRDRKKALDPLRKSTRVELPPIDLGTLVVVDAKDTTSACVVLTSSKAIMAGDKVSTLQAD
jgi:LysM repeat protein